MKLFKYIAGISIGISLLVFPSCDTELNLLPSTDIEEEVTFQTLEGAEAALNGAYRCLRVSEYNHYNINHLFFIPEVMGDDMFISKNSNYGRYKNEYEYSVIPSVTQATETWATPYLLIANTNLIINGMGELPDSDKKTSILGQAHALRGYMYHFLVRLFAQPYSVNPDAPGVVLREVVSTAPVKRSTVKDAYTLIVNDLEFAAKNLKPGSDKALIDQKAAQALLARVYLDMGAEYADKAVDMAQKAVDGKKLMDQDAYITEEFSSINSETFWSFSTVSGNHGGYLSVASFYYLAGGGNYIKKADGSYEVDKEGNKVINYTDVIDGYNSMKVSKNFIEMFDDKDVRKKLFPKIKEKKNPADPNDDTMIETQDFLSYENEYFTTKHRHKEGALGIADLNMIRAAEMYLIIAEVEADRNQSGKAKDALNVLREARGLDKFEGTGQALVDAIQLERRFELFGEGHRIFDMKRRKQPLNRVGLQGHWAKNVEVIPANDNIFSFPIPQKEFDGNKELKFPEDQNPGYY